MNLNKIILMGRITADPEIKKTQSDISVCRFTVAVNRRDKEKTTDFIECSAFRNTADFIGKYFRKGSAIIVCGSLQTNNFTDKDGNKRKSYSVIADEVQFGYPFGIVITVHDCCFLCEFHCRLLCSFSGCLGSL